MMSRSQAVVQVVPCTVTAVHKLRLEVASRSAGNLNALPVCL